MSTTMTHADASELEMLRSSVREAFKQEVETHGGISEAASKWPALWAVAHDLGLDALGADETLGGVEALCAAMEQCGHVGAPIPLLPSFLANRLLGVASIARGNEDIACIAFGTLDGDAAAGSVSEANGSISGRLRLVEYADHATHLAAFVSPTRVAWIALDAAGVSTTVQPGLARPPLTNIVLDKVPAQCFDVPTELTQDARDIARLALTARALGAATRAFDLVVDHAKTRQQFGQPIGKFQAIQHKLADCLTRLDSVRLTLECAASNVDARHDDRRFFASAAFAAANPMLRQTMLEVQHTFGAIGYAEEHESPQHFRRVHADLLRVGGVRTAREELAAWLLDAKQSLPTHDLGPAPEQLRQEVRQWLDENWTDEERERTLALPNGDHGWSQAFSRKMAQRGLIGLSWPRKFGGGERSVLEQFAVIEELERSGAANSYHAAAENLIGPAIAAFGTQEQKEKFLPAILRGELSICLGYSEPEAGSDLASLRTKAVRDGDDWVITGQKLWTTAIEHAQYIWLAARTNPQATPPHAGISIFMVPLDTPGITRRPSMAFYGQPFDATFWDEVRVPGDALIGEVDGGWKVITHALAAERLLMGGHVARLQAAFERLCAHVAADATLHVRTDVRSKLGELAAEVEVARQLVLRTVRMLAAGKLPLQEAGMCKAYSGELMERMSEAAMDLLGASALLSREATDVPLAGGIEQMLRTSIMMVVGGGTSEVQRNLIARSLGLPR
ncbi:MAG: acyl-CoA dehydrogenase [Pseudoxanthomonas sp.]